MSPLEGLIRARIAAGGPMPLPDYMALALTDPEHGYYARREPFGPAGDFVTAPEVSQMFGELVGLWLADLWLRAGRPPRVRLVELGPGRGTLMADLLRATARVPGFHAAVEFHLVEASARLRAAQAERVPAATWHDRFEDVPAGAPLLLVANEFFDALPIVQVERTLDGWRDRRLLVEGGRLTLRPVGPVATRFVPPLLQDVKIGSVVERSPAGEALAAAIGARLAADGGAALIVDYGHAGPALGDTLQAICGGAFADPLATPGEADLSAHVDFTALGQAAKAAGAMPHGPIDQGDLLLALGLRERADTLKRGLDPRAAAGIEAAFARLAAPAAMGRLFKALALTGRGWPQPAGFA